MKFHPAHKIMPVAYLIGRKPINAPSYEIKANCYAFALGLKLGIGGYAQRPMKSQPGHRCGMGPRVNLNRKSTLVRKDLIRRVQCDNPDCVTYIQPKYPKRTLNMSVPEDSHMFACIYGKEDFHFLRRMYTKDVLKEKLLMEALTPVQYEKIKKGSNKHKFCWVHQRGWSKQPTVVDASGNICWSPVPAEANWSLDFTSMPITNNFNYTNESFTNYNHFAGIFVVKSRKAKVFSSNNTLPNVALVKSGLHRLGLNQDLSHMNVKIVTINNKN